MAASSASQWESDRIKTRLVRRNSLVTDDRMCHIPLWIIGRLDDLGDREMVVQARASEVEVLQRAIIHRLAFRPKVPPPQANEEA